MTTPMLVPSPGEARDAVPVVESLPGPHLIPRRWAVLSALAGVAVVALAAAGAVELGTSLGWVATAIAAAWVVAAWAVIERDEREVAGGWHMRGWGVVVWSVGLAVAVVVWTTAHVADEPWAVVRAVAVAWLPAAVALLLAWAPVGGRPEHGRRASVVVVAVGAASAAVHVAGRPDVSAAVIVVESVVVGAAGAWSFVASCRRASTVDRARLQWVGWGLLVAATTAGVVGVMSWMSGWPEQPDTPALAATVAVPLGIVASSRQRLLGAAASVLVHTIVLAGMLGFVAVVYVVTVVGLDGVPDEGERTVLVLSMLAALVVAVLGVPVRRWLSDAANRRVYGDSTAPDDALETFATRMSRAIPMDELLLQLVESLKKTMRLRAAEVWTGADGVYERTVSVPDRPRDRLVLRGEALPVAARAHVQGNAWLSVWIPSLLADRPSTIAVRFTSVSHLGQLLGFIVTERPLSEVALDEDDEHRVLVDIARQLGLALHNVSLDSALQASLEELQVTNRELVESRARIVNASDESRRRIERNLHDGAQQHLVAMAVKVGLVRQLLDADPETATAMLEELRTDVQSTLTELRELAHGIYPPLLRDRGLPEALRTAAARSTLPVSVSADGVGRYQADVEAAVYFCCLEAIQNAGKHAGDGATVTVVVREDGEVLEFVVTDDGVGFEAASDDAGHGFVNMRDRLGAFAGTMDVASSTGGGTTVTGRLPIA